MGRITLDSARPDILKLYFEREKRYGKRGDPELEWNELIKLPVDAEDSDDEQKIR